MTDNQLTIEQALSNIKLVLESFKGTKGEHIALEQSFFLVAKACEPCATKSCEKPVLEGKSKK